MFSGAGAGFIWHVRIYVCIYVYMYLYITLEKKSGFIAQGTLSPVIPLVYSIV